MEKYKDAVYFMESCYQLYEQKMYGVAYAILRDVQMAEDAVQEAFLQLMKKEVQFEDPESVECRKYIVTTIKNVSINIYRKKKREQEWMYLSDQEEMLQKESAVAEEESCEVIEEMIENIPIKYAAVVRLLVLQNLSVKETADKLGISEANVRKRFERAKKMLTILQKGSDENATGRIIYGGIHS